MLQTKVLNLIAVMLLIVTQCSMSRLHIDSTILRYIDSTGERAGLVVNA